tara:strand:+ start:8479 stop:8826 length:348 start_codon:yes stop_codon:yes gene_type:complete
MSSHGGKTIAFTMPSVARTQNAHCHVRQSTQSSTTTLCNGTITHTLKVSIDLRNAASGRSGIDTLVTPIGTLRLGTSFANFFFEWGLGSKTIKRIESLSLYPPHCGLHQDTRDLR